MHKQITGALSMTPATILEALPDAFAIKAGHRVTHAHPHAEQLAGMSLGEIARVAGECKAASEGYRQSSGAVLGLGMASQDFTLGMASALRNLMVRAYDTQADHRAVCAVREVPDFREQEYPTVDLAGDLSELFENGERHQQAFDIARGERLRLRSFGGVIRVPRQALIADNFDTMAQAFAGLGSGSARQEARMIFDSLENTAALVDGEPVFSTDHGNRIEQPLSKGALSQAMAALRTMPVKLGRRSEPANLRARHLLVSAASELEAFEILHEAGLEYRARQIVSDTGTGIEVTASPHLAPGSWYLLPDPATWPVLVRLTLRGTSDTRPGLVTPTRRGLDNFDGLGFSYAADLGGGLVSRLAIKGGE
jgi:hypothetical protein